MINSNTSAPLGRRYKIVRKRDSKVIWSTALRAEADAFIEMLDEQFGYECDYGSGDSYEIRDSLGTVQIGTKAYSAPHDSISKVG